MCVKMGSQVELNADAGLALRWLEVCLSQTAAGEHVVYITAGKPILAVSPFPILTENRCHYSCCTHK